MAVVRAHFCIRGRVQGVGFRYFALKNAINLGLGGWVRNCYDGTVEGVVEGPKAQVEEFLALCRQGPRWARVESLEVRYEEPQAEKSFKIREGCSSWANA